MEFFSILGNAQRLDGGSMFGNCPRAVWEKWCPADESHRIDLACRCLLVREDDGRLLLFEAGIGAFFEPKLQKRFGIQSSEHALLDNLNKLNISPSDIDVVVLSHLHFDHAGGLLSAFEPGHESRLVFSNAEFVIGEKNLERAESAHPRDRASFVPHLNKLLRTSGRLNIVPHGAHSIPLLGDKYRFNYSDGHTPGLMLTTISDGENAVMFMGDLIPGTPWVHLPITMGYDRFAELVIDEKAALLPKLADEGTWLFYTHDPIVAASRVERDERGKFVAIRGRAELCGDL